MPFLIGLLRCLNKIADGKFLAQRQAVKGNHYCFNCSIESFYLPKLWPIKIPLWKLWSQLSHELEHSPYIEARDKGCSVSSWSQISKSSSQPWAENSYFVPMTRSKHIYTIHFLSLFFVRALRPIICPI